ncbi:hypothetical protein GCM10018952_77430 [Streptosporangium vulgare]
MCVRRATLPVSGSGGTSRRSVTPVIFPLHFLGALVAVAAALYVLAGLSRRRPRTRGLGAARVPSGRDDFARSFRDDFVRSGRDGRDDAGQGDDGRRDTGRDDPAGSVTRSGEVRSMPQGVRNGYFTPRTVSHAGRSVRATLWIRLVRTALRHILRREVSGK